MQVLKAKIKRESIYFPNGLNPKGKPVWLQITGFKAKGDENYKVKAIKEIKNGLPQWVELWMDASDLQIRKFEDRQLPLPFKYE